MDFHIKLSLYFENTPIEPFPKLINSDFENLNCIIRGLLTLGCVNTRRKIHKCEGRNCVKCEFEEIVGLYNANSNEISLLKLLEFLGIPDWSTSNIIESMNLLFQALHRTDPLDSALICRPKCLLHKSQPIISQETICPCGHFSGHALPKFSFGLSIRVSTIIKPKSSSFELFFEDGQLKNYAYHSVAKFQINAINDFLHEFLKSEIEQQNEKCADERCFNVPTNSIKTCSETKLLMILLDFEGVEKTSFNILQVAVFMSEKLEPRTVYNNSSKSLYLKTIILENQMGEVKVLSFIKNSWHEVCGPHCKRIGSGEWIDVMVYLLWYFAIPIVLFYEQTRPIHYDINVFQIGLFEKLSYMREIYQIHEIKDISKIDIVRDTRFSNATAECNCCQELKGFCKKCKNCGYIEGDWVCINCKKINVAEEWVCELCEHDRISFDMDNYCMDCKKTSKKVNYCKYCKSSECSLCKKLVFSYSRIYCCECNKLLLSIQHEFPHEVLCYKCHKEFQS